MAYAQGAYADAVYTNYTRPLPSPAAGVVREAPLRHARKAHLLPTADVLLGPAAVTALLWFTRLNEVSIVQSIAAFVLLLLTWVSYRRWQRSERRGLPLFSAVAAMYWLYYGLQVFWGDRRAIDWRTYREVSSAAVTQALLLVVLGMACLWYGIQSEFGRRLALKRFPELSTKSFTWIYLLGLGAAGTLMSAVNVTSAGGEGLRQALFIVQVTSSSAAFLILFWRVLDKKAGKVERSLLFVLLAVRVVAGIATGWMGSVLTLGEGFALVYVLKYRRLPIAVVACGLAYLMFFNAGKGEFRKTFWYSRNQTDATTVQRAQFLLDASIRNWQQALDDPSRMGVGLLLSTQLSRVSLLSQTANVIEQTPAIVPYQYGRLYSYLAVALVPRFFWPEKPSMNEANRFYQVAYGITREQDLQYVSIAVGTLTEGYINFGWLGIAIVMFLIGVVLDFWNETFLSRSGAVLAIAVGAAITPQLIAVETQLAQYASGILQNVFLTVLVFLPVIRWRSAALTARPKYPEWPPVRKSWYPRRIPL